MGDPLDVKSSEYKIDKGTIAYRLDSIDHRLSKFDGILTQQGIMLAQLGVKSKIGNTALISLSSALTVAIGLAWIMLKG